MSLGSDAYRPLEDKEIVLSGRLASYTREQAEALVAQAGGRCRAMPSARTAILVAGDGGCPLAPDGKPTRALRQAERLRAAGARLQVMDEEEFLRLLGPDLAPDLQRQHTIAQLSRMLGADPPLIRSWVRAGLLRPARTMRQMMCFEFREVARARVLLELSRAGVSPARVARSLQQLGGWLPAAHRSLSQLEAMTRGDVVVRLDNGQLAEPSGQLRLGFALPEEAAPPPRRLATGPHRDAAGHFDQALQAEGEGRLEAAVDAYHEALVAGGPDPEIAFNMGNVLYAMERTAEALQRYLQAVELDPEYAEAWNNLGNALAELDRHARAEHAYRKALQLAPDYSDVHFNLAETLLQLGRADEARSHWQEYLARDSQSAWASEARARLRDLEPDDDDDTPDD